MRFVDPPQNPEITTKVVVVTLRNGSVLQSAPMLATEAEELLGQVYYAQSHPERMTIQGPVPNWFDLGPPAGGGAAADIASAKTIPA